MSGSTGLWLAAGLALLLVGRAAAQSGHPIRSTLWSAVCGIGALGAVNLMAPATGVALPVGYVSSFMAVVLGAPGVISLLFLRLILG